MRLLSLFVRKRYWIPAGVLLLLGATLFADWYSARPVATLQQSTYVGRQTCAQCHPAEHDQWVGSHHDRAMEIASAQSILGDFNNAEFERLGVTTRFYREDETYFVATEGPDGKYDEFEVKYTFGVDPLQQYMVELPGGKLQVLRVAWDVAEQEWFYVYPPDAPDERFPPDDPMHWTGLSQNWNTMCAECHSTDLRKNYDLQSTSYDTTYEEIDVSCEACHGPGSLHIELANARSLFWDRNVGYGLARLKSKDPTTELETCATCHSRRTMVEAGFRPGKPFLNYYEPALLDEGLYHADGQILDEVYVYGSFLQSKMFHEGVRCTDCHHPHTARLKFNGNQLCTQCHTAGKYDAPAHHHHPADSSGAQCVECHMPATTYMVVDPRRDHRFGIPQPDLTVEIGTPNACANCHSEPKETAEWAADWIRKWYGDSRAGDPHWARAIAAGRNGAADGLRQLTDVIRGKSTPAIVKATALKLLGAYEDPSAGETIRVALDDAHALVRTAAARVVQSTPLHPPQRQLAPLLTDRVPIVRMAAATRLTEFPSLDIPSASRHRFHVVLDEYRDALMEYRERGTAHLNLGSLERRMGQLEKAARAFQTAIRLEPYLTGPRSELASTLEELAKDASGITQLRREEVVLLERDIKLVPDSAMTFYRLGLTYYLIGEIEKAEDALRQAVEIAPDSYDYLMMLALLQERLEKWQEATDSLNRMHEMRPQDPRARAIFERMRQTRAAGDARDN